MLTKLRIIVIVWDEERETNITFEGWGGRKYGIWQRGKGYKLITFVILGKKRSY